MSDLTLASGEALLVASRGATADHGLTRWTYHGKEWRGKLLATVNHLSSLTQHPSLPIIYGTSGTYIGEGGVHAWLLNEDRAELISECPSRGSETCHLVVDPSGRLLIWTNYLSSALGVQSLTPDGRFDGPVELIRLRGDDGPDPVRQEDAHPHQAFFIDETLIIIDLGADAIREFSIDREGRGASALRPTRTTFVPAETGPRHAVVLPDGRLAVSGELGSNLVVGRLGDAPELWANVSSTERTGPATTRHLRNYPGDIRRSLDGRFVYFANRGYDTISVFDVSGQVPRPVAERDATVAWPQHLLVMESHVVVAGWDSSKVVALPLTAGVPGQAELVFECAGAGWLMLWR
jgi:6-phosphogluconolactonase